MTLSVPIRISIHIRVYLIKFKFLDFELNAG